jgi:chromosome segregation ATPase
MNTLTGIEAERVVQILKYASDRLVVLSYLPGYKDEGMFDDMDNAVLKGLLTRQWSTEDNFMSIRDGLSAAEISLQKQMHKCSRATCRALSTDRAALQTLMNRPEQQSEDFTKFIRYLNDLRSHIKTRMTTTVEDEASNRNMLHDLTEKERQAEESREALQSKLNEVRDQKEHVTFGLDQILRKLRLELSDLTQQNKVELENVQKETVEAISKATSDHELRMRQLQDAVDNMDKNLNETVEKNREVEVRLRKDKARHEKELNGKILSFDTDMEDRRRTLQKMEKDFSNESSEFAVLKEYFDKIDADLGRESEEENILGAVKARVDFAAKYISDACAKLQSLARGRISRAEVAKLKSKKKKGKKK